MKRKFNLLLIILLIILISGCEKPNKRITVEVNNQILNSYNIINIYEKDIKELINKGILFDLEQNNIFNDKEYIYRVFMEDEKEEIYQYNNIKIKWEK